MDGLISTICASGAAFLLIGGLAVVGFFGYLIYAILAGLASM